MNGQQVRSGPASHTWAQWRNGGCAPRASPFLAAQARRGSFSAARWFAGRGVMPTDRVKIFLGDASRFPAAEFMPDQRGCVGCLRAHDPAENSGCTRVDSKIGPRERDCDEGGTRMLGHGCNAGLNGGFVTTPFSGLARHFRGGSFRRNRRHGSGESTRRSVVELRSHSVGLVGAR